MVERQQDRRPDPMFDVPTTDEIRAASANAGMIRQMGDLPPAQTFTIEGILDAPQPNGLPPFRWTYLDVDTQGIFTRIIVDAIAPEIAIRIIREHFPSFQPSSIRHGSFVGQDLPWHGILPARKRRNWLARLFTKTQPE